VTDELALTFNHSHDHIEDIETQCAREVVPINPRIKDSDESDNPSDDDMGDRVRNETVTKRSFSSLLLWNRAKICGTILAVAVLMQTISFTVFDGSDFSMPLSKQTQKSRRASNEHMDGIIPGAHVDLFPWESTHQGCNPPNGIPSFCCIGSYSAGGGMSFFPNSPCANRSMVDDYGRAKQVATGFLEQHPVEGNECDVCQIVNILIDYNLTMAFHGDSVSHQTYSGLECELRRRGYLIDVVAGDFEDRNKTAFWKYGLSQTRNLTVTRPNETMHAKLAFYQMYRPFEDNKETKNIARESDIVVFDHGLHWGLDEKNDFKNAMATLLRGYSRNETKGDKLKLLAWRETSAQHFNTSTGDYSSDSPYETECIPIRKYQPFRAPLMTEAAGLAGFTVSNASDPLFLSQPVSRGDELVILPYNRFTSEMHQLHPNECTHFCHTPNVWLPIWRTLRLALDRAILNTKINVFSVSDGLLHCSYRALYSTVHY
jgi:hypothetical protein